MAGRHRRKRKKERERLKLLLTNKDLTELRARPRKLSPANAQLLANEVLRLRAFHEEVYDVSQPPEVVYHYCSEEAFQSIMKSGELWLSDSEYTNDEQENRWAPEKIEQYARDLLPATELERQLSVLTVTRVPPHIACLSKYADRLSLWRGYAEDGHGFAVGFNVSRLGLDQSVFDMSISTMPALGSFDIDRPDSLVGVAYPDELQRSLVERGIQCGPANRESKHGYSSIC